MQQQYMKQWDMTINSHAPIDMTSKVYTSLITRCDLVFQKKIEVTYSDDVVIGNPTISSKKIGSMIDLYTSSMTSYVNAFFELLGFNLKSTHTKILNLQQSSYYKRQILYNMLAMSRQRNPYTNKSTG